MLILAGRMETAKLICASPFRFLLGALACVFWTCSRVMVQRESAFGGPVICPRIDHYVACSEGRRGQTQS